MKQSIYHRLSSILWGAIVVLIVLLAVYVSLGRTLSALTGSFQREILQELNLRVPFIIDADEVSARWHSFAPELVLNGLRLTTPGEPGRFIELDEGRIALDVAGSLVSGALQITWLHLNGLDLAAEFGDDGMLRIRGFRGADSPLGEWLQDFLLNVERVTLGDTHLAVLLPGGEERGFGLDLALSRDGSHRRLKGSLRSSRGMQIFVLGEGMGNPFNPESFSGQLYFDVSASDLGAVNDLLPDSLSDLRLDGSLGLELWSSWDFGKSATSLRFSMDDAQLSARDVAWRVPFDRLAFDASLVDRNGGWGLSVAGLDLVRGETRLQVPRLQLDIRGQTVDLRALDLPLAPLGSLLAGIESLPPAALDLLQVLQPRGVMPAVKINVADISAPQSDWQLQVNFDQLAVDPWHGAPGVTGASGYLEIVPESGVVVLDSRLFSLDFPTVYESPLRYDDFHGTIRIDWDEERVKLSSGLVEARGTEGRVPVLFGLTIPLLASDVGLEMDLLVGLQDIHPDQREKYIPFILDEGLRSWLTASIGEGRIEQGGFLWRGSLKPNAPALRTVQLFFNIEDTNLSYHPDWPSLADVDGTVLIDDSNVSVWANSSRLLDSTLNDLSVEVWPDRVGELWLAVDGSMVGPAGDGLAVINNSPLGGLAAHAFSDWRLGGRLATDLELLLNLSDHSVAPVVDVSARFDAVELDILPGELPLREISGFVDYTSARGFSSRELTGRLWGQPLQAVVSQRTGAAGTDRSTPVVELTSTVDMRDVQQWLAPDLLGFAVGRAAVTAQFVALPDAAIGDDSGRLNPPQLTIDSSLLGISLDLPEPWNKPAEAERPLHLDLSFGRDALAVDIALAGGLQGQLELVAGRLHAAAVGLGRDPPEPESGRVHIVGHAKYADVTQWQRFITDYFLADPGPADSSEQDNVAASDRAIDRRQESAAPAMARPATQDSVFDQDPAPAISEIAAQGPVLGIFVDQLRIDRLVAGGRDLGEVLVSLSDEAGQWRLAAETHWLSGELHYVADGESSLDIRYLDLAGLDSTTSTAAAMPAAEAEIIALPDVAVRIAELRRADTLLGDLAFDLRSEGADLYARNISGQIAAMELSDQAPGQLLWRQGPNSRTSIEATFSFQDLGQSLEQLGYQKIIETEQGSFGLALDWAGGPGDFSLSSSEGSLQVDIGEGNFPEAPGGAAGALRVVSILNLAEIVQRLSLTQMFDSGIPFNKVDGEVLLHDGTIEVNDMSVQGGASSFQFNGMSVVESQSLDGELVVTLPVASNLPWVAALTAGLPVAAGVFLLSKVFESPINRLTSAVYTATGTWDDPKVEFDRVFDDTAAPAPSAVAVEAAKPDAGERPALPVQSETP